jgi:regulator of replication initiation timing
MYEGLEELRKEMARFNAELEMLRTKVMICIEVTARLREEFDGLRRKVRGRDLKEYIETLRVVEAGEREPS